MTGAGPERPELHPLNAEPFEATLYHGSGSRFGEFDRRYLGKGTGGPDTQGFYLSNDRDAARYFARQCHMGALYVYTVTVSLMLPLWCRRADLSNTSAALVADQALRRLYDGAVFPNGPRHTLFAMVFWPRCLLVVNVDEVTG